MRITVLLAQFAAGGAERQTYELMRRLPRGEFAVQCIVLSEDIEPYGPALRSEGIPVTTLTRSGSYDVGRVRRLRRLLLEQAPDVLHAIGYEPASYAWFANLGRRRTALVPSIRSAVLFPKWPKPLIYRGLFRSSPRAIFNSRRGRDYALRHFGALAERSVVIANGLPFGEISAAAEAGPDVRSVLGVPPATPVLGFVGKDSWQKNVRRFLQVAQGVMAARPDVHCALLGWKLAEADRARFGIEDPRVHFLGVRQDVYPLMAGFTALVMTSETEGCPNVVLEAAGLGVPVVAPDVGDVREILGGEGADGLVPAQHVPDYVRRVTRVLDHPESAAASARALRDRVLVEYDVNRMVAATASLYRCAASA